MDKNGETPFNVSAVRNRNANSGKEMADYYSGFGDPKLEHVNNEGKICF